MLAALLAPAAILALAGPPALTVSFDAATRSEPATGRLVVYLVRDGAKVSGDPADAPHFDDPQPMFGIDVRDLVPAAPATIDDAATAFPCPWSALPTGHYKAQAVLDLHRENSSWRREPGNLYSDVVSFQVTAKDTPPPLAIKLSKAVEPRNDRTFPGVEVFELRSAFLSDFHGHDVTLRAGIMLPNGFDPSKRYAAVYEVPGFGGDYTGAFQRFHPYRARLPADSPWITLRDNALWIVLDPESPNGHTLFADSANNGPWGRALVEELIPALEKKYPLVADPKARLLRGHSSGGWSTIWLAITYPETFGACWSSSPDPVDFRRMQRCDIYRSNVYAHDEHGGDGDIPSYRSNGKARMSVRQENLMEEVIGPDNTSGQQWDSWFAVFGPRSDRGNPAALFDPVTGAIDKAVAEQYRKYDITDLVKREPGKYALLFKERIRLIVGTDDNYYLNEAVALLQDELENTQFLHLPEGGHGTVRIVPGRDHGTIFGTPEIQGIPQEMVDHLKRAGLIGR